MCCLAVWVLSICGVLGAPVITAPPQSVVTILGTDVAFAIEATADGPVSYLWQKDGVTIPGAGGGTLSLAQVKRSDIGRYRAVVTADGGAVTSAPAALLLTASVQPSTQSIVVPPGSSDPYLGVSASADLGQGLRHTQQAYSATFFPTGALLITEIRFRPDAATGRAFTNTTPRIQFTLSTSPRPADFPSSYFATNRGADSVVVVNGSLDLSSQFAGPDAGPKAFDIRVPLSTPFLYVPSEGAFLLEIQTTATASSVSPLGGVSLPNDGASRLWAASAAFPRGNLDVGADALELVYIAGLAPEAAPVPVPGSDGVLVVPRNLAWR